MTWRSMVYSARYPVASDVVRVLLSGSASGARMLAKAGCDAVAATPSGEAMAPRVLIAEDDEAIRELLMALLCTEGYIPTSVPDGAAAVERIQADHPDLVLLDLDLPELSGRQVLQTIKANERLRDVPVILLSAYTARLTVRERRLAAFIVAKPFDLDELVRVLRLALDGERKDRPCAGEDT